MVTGTGCQVALIWILNSPFIEAWFPSSQHWEVVEPLSGACGRNLSLWGVPLKAVFGPSPFLSVCFLATGSSLHYCPNTLPHHSSKQWSHVTMTSNLWNHESIFPLYKVIISGILSQQEKTDYHMGPDQIWCSFYYVKDPFSKLPALIALLSISYNSYFKRLEYFLSYYYRCMSTSSLKSLNISN